MNKRSQHADLKSRYVYLNSRRADQKASHRISFAQGANPEEAGAFRPLKPASKEIGALAPGLLILAISGRVPHTSILMCGHRAKLDRLLLQSHKLAEKSR